MSPKMWTVEGDVALVRVQGTLLAGYVAVVVLIDVGPLVNEKVSLGKCLALGFGDTIQAAFKNALSEILGHDEFENPLTGRTLAALMRAADDAPLHLPEES